MIKFPELKGEEKALVIAERSTGVVLDEDFNRVLGDDKNFYLIFPNLAMAKSKALDILKMRPNVEVVIYDNNQKMVKRLM